LSSRSWSGINGTVKAKNAPSTRKARTLLMTKTGNKALLSSDPR
jgi:hypothetical protein